MPETKEGTPYRKTWKDGVIIFGGGGLLVLFFLLKQHFHH